MKLNELLDILNKNKDVPNNTYLIRVEGMKNAKKYVNNTLAKALARTPENVLEMTVLGYISKDEFCDVMVDDIHEKQ